MHLHCTQFNVTFQTAYLCTCKQDLCTVLESYRGNTIPLIIKKLNFKFKNKILDSYFCFINNVLYVHILGVDVTYIFQRFPPSSAKKLAFFWKNNVMLNFLHCKNANFFRRKYSLNHNIGPCSYWNRLKTADAYGVFLRHRKIKESQWY
jgi:hypothetical protein